MFSADLLVLLIVVGIVAVVRSLAIEPHDGVRLRRDQVQDISPLLHRTTKSDRRVRRH
jgi:hypothetical protein